MEEHLTGEIRLFPYGFAPQGWYLCNGQLLSVSANYPLFQVIGTKFGGDGTSNFAVPNLTGARPLNVNQSFMCYYISAFNNYDLSKTEEIINK